MGLNLHYPENVYMIFLNLKDIVETVLLKQAIYNHFQYIIHSFV
jgi:hypothetical protein